jgi:two-component system, OmpR family, heavy metal sensor histidine kinase CusS
MKGLAESKHQRLVCYLPPFPILLEGNETLLGRLVGILLDNAVKYTPEQGMIQVKLASNGNTSELRVEDNGIGITPEVLPRIFDRFFRADPVRNQDGGGSGLGLAIAKWIADAHSAKLTVQSEPGAGTVFTVSFSAAHST